MSTWLDWLTPRRVRTALVMLSSAALALGIIAYFVVFFPTGSYQPVTSTGPSTTFSNISSSTISSSTAFVVPSSTATSSTSSGGTAATPGTTDFSYPYPITWNEGHEQFSVTAVSLSNTTLTLTLAIQMGNTAECVPINVRFIADEEGTQKTPDSPSGANFTFPDTQTCEGTPNSIYSQSLSFTVDPTQMPLLFTTGGASNEFFQVNTDASGNLTVTTPSTQD